MPLRELGLKKGVSKGMSGTSKKTGILIKKAYDSSVPNDVREE